jgi:hypothetical protein
MVQLKMKSTIELTIYLAMKDIRFKIMKRKEIIKKQKERTTNIWKMMITNLLTN